MSPDSWLANEQKGWKSRQYNTFPVIFMKKRWHLKQTYQNFEWLGDGSNNHGHVNFGGCLKDNSNANLSKIQMD